MVVKISDVVKYIGEASRNGLARVPQDSNGPRPSSLTDVIKIPLSEGYKNRSQRNSNTNVDNSNDDKTGHEYSSGLVRTYKPSRAPGYRSGNRISVSDMGAGAYETDVSRARDLLYEIADKSEDDTTLANYMAVVAHEAASDDHIDAVRNAPEWLKRSELRERRPEAYRMAMELLYQMQREELKEAA